MDHSNVRTKTKNQWRVRKAICDHMLSLLRDAKNGHLNITGGELKIPFPYSSFTKNFARDEMTRAPLCAFLGFAVYMNRRECKYRHGTV